MDVDLLPGDYLPPGMAAIRLDDAFPDMISEVVTPEADLAWPTGPRFKQYGHRRYADREFPGVGFVTREEALILHNNARLFAGLPAIEIGFWLGWSFAHIATANCHVDCFDPIFASPRWRPKIDRTIASLGLTVPFHLDAGPSPSSVVAYAREHGRRWHFAFIDGDHKSPGPLLDAVAVLPFLARDCMVLFHDLVSPDVFEGFRHFGVNGFQLRILDTMQIMGVAWRGNVDPVPHQPDPAIAWARPPHLNALRAGG